MASEVGVVKVDPTNVKIKGRLQPGRMFMLDFDQGRLIPDQELKQTIYSKRPYGDWLSEQKVTLRDIASHFPPDPIDADDTLERMKAFG